MIHIPYSFIPRRVFGGLSFKFCFFFFLSLLPLFPYNLFYLFQLDGGINFFNQDKNKLVQQYNLDDLRNTIAPVFNVRTGVVWDKHWLFLLGYGFIRREDYDYRLNYFTYNQKVYEQRDIHQVHFQSGYFLFPYQNNYNISFELGLGWALYRSTHTTIDNYSASSSSGLRQRNRILIFQLHQFYMSPTIKFYRNLRREKGLGGDIYLGVQYPMIFHSKINFPVIVLGFDASIDFSFGSEKKKSTFVSDEKDPELLQEIENKDNMKSEEEKSVEPTPLQPN